MNPLRLTHPGKRPTHGTSGQRPVGGRPIPTSYCNRINGMMPGLQPLRCFDGPFPGAVPQTGMVRTFGAGERELHQWPRFRIRRIVRTVGAGEGEPVIRRWRRGKGVCGSVFYGSHLWCWGKGTPPVAPFSDTSYCAHGWCWGRGTGNPQMVEIIADGERVCAGVC